MAWYRTGTINVTNGDTAVTGENTRFASNARVGDGLRTPDGEWYEIVNIASETTIGIFPAYQGPTASGQVYAVAPLQGYVKESADRLRAITEDLGNIVKSVAGKTGDVTLVKGDVGLGNVDNTSDANKPISTAQQSALNTKLDTSVFNNNGFGGPIARNLTNNDCNQTTGSGWFNGASGDALNRPPAITFFTLYVVSVGGYIIQTAHELFTGRTATRAFNVTNGEWSPWQREAFLTDLGTSASRDSVVSLTDTTSGRVMTVGSGGLLGESPRVTNLNTTLKGGSYSFVTGVIGAPSGENFGTIFVEAWDANNVTQTLKTVGEATSRVYLRSTANGGVSWGPWVRYTSENGSNANGRYTKFSDGTLICEGTITLPAMASATSVSANATFAMAFSSSPRVVYNPTSAVGSGSQADVGLVLYNGPYSSATAAGWTLSCYAYRSATTFPVQFSYIAYGRWF